MAKKKPKRKIAPKKTQPQLPPPPPPPPPPAQELEKQQPLPPPPRCPCHDMPPVVDMLRTLIYDVSHKNHELAMGNMHVASLNKIVADEHVRKIERVIFTTCPYCQSFLQVFPRSQTCLAIRNETPRGVRRESMLPQSTSQTRTFNLPEI